MDNFKQSVPILAGVAAGAVGMTIVASKMMTPRTTRDTEVLEENGPGEMLQRDYTNVLIGDVGGTNVRFKIIRLFHEQPEKKEVIKELTIYNPQKEESFLFCIKQFLHGLNNDETPTIGVVGIAGAVIDNRVVTVNIPHWPTSNGNAVKEICGFDKFIFINDFIAAGFGICVL